MIIRDTLACALTRAAEQARESGALEVETIPAVQLDLPPSEEFGDFSSDLAVALGRQARRPAADVARLLADRLEPPQGIVERVEVAGSGFLNFRLRPDWIVRAVEEARTLGEAYGRCPDLGEGKSAQVEFVSANPTGPLTVTHGRGAALGDTLARVLEWSGFRVTREFYVNDAGTNMDRFGRAVAARLARPTAAVPTAFESPQERYLARVADVVRAGLAPEFEKANPEQRVTEVTRLGRDEVLRQQRETLADFGVRFDEWYSETVLYAGGRLAEVVQLLRDSGDAYVTDGAVWLATTRYGDEVDRALLRSNGRPTYLAADLAYHLDKFRRGFDRIIDVWGAEHEGYIGRTRAGVQALGCDPGALEILIFCPVALKVDGMVVEASGPGGNNRCLAEVIEEVGPGVARFFYLVRPANSPLDYDLDLARKPTLDNPVRQITAALAAAESRGGVNGGGALGAPQSTAERALMRGIADFPDEVRAAARDRDPSRLVRYAETMAAAFLGFDEAAEPAAGRNGSRAAVSEASAVVLRNVMSVLGLSLPAA